MTDKENHELDRLTQEAETVLDTNYEKKDLKERRGVAKNSLYIGSNKLKHRVPPGKTH